MALHTNSEGFAAWVQEHAAVTLFREGKVSSGVAAEWLGISRVAFLLKAMDQGAEFLEDSEDDLARETALL